MSAHKSVNPEDALRVASVDAAGVAGQGAVNPGLFSELEAEKGRDLSFGCGSFTAIGSFSGPDPTAAARFVFDELPDFPCLPELPARGPWADIIGRAAGLLVDMPIELTSFGWQLTRRPGVDVRRAKDLLERDLDAMAQAGDGYCGLFKVQIPGPWTIASTVELRQVDRVLGDLSATRDLAQSLAEGITQHLNELHQRLPAAQFIVQIDEPAISGVINGTISTRSGLSNLAAVDENVAAEYLRISLDVCPAAVIHCCAADVPINVLHRAGTTAISCDITRLSAQSDEDIGRAVESGMTLFLGLVPTAPTSSQLRPDVVAKPALELWNRLGFQFEDLARHVVTPTCGLAGSSADYSRKAIRLAQQTARFFSEGPE